ncbi:MAG: PCMD domain-containing protein [Bacteroidetes bacterium]|nr:PCMD domain-containing protein [Bacteroidota bacterium]
MKKTLLFLSFLSLGISLSAQPIVNGDVESWQSYNDVMGSPYDDLGPNTDRSTNFLRTLNAILEAPLTQQSAYKVTGQAAYSNTSIVVVTTMVAGSILVPGYLGTGDVDISAATIYLGRPFTGRPTAMKGMYRYESVNGDSAAFYCSFSKYDALNQTSSVIGEGNLVVSTAVPEWTPFQVPITFTSTDSPDSTNIIIASSAGYDLVNLQGSVGQVNSALYLDDISFEFPASLDTYSEGNALVYPNPSSDEVRVQLENAQEKLRLRLYNASGQQVLETRGAGNEISASVVNLPAGTYVLMVQTDFKLLHRAVISVQH